MTTSGNGIYSYTYWSCSHNPKKYVKNYIRLDQVPVGSDVTAKVKVNCKTCRGIKITEKELNKESKKKEDIDVAEVGPSGNADLQPITFSAAEIKRQFENLRKEILNKIDSTERAVLNSMKQAKVIYLYSYLPYLTLYLHPYLPMTFIPTAYPTSYLP